MTAITCASIESLQCTNESHLTYNNPMRRYMVHKVSISDLVAVEHTNGVSHIIAGRKSVIQDYDLKLRDLMREIMILSTSAQDP